MIEIDGSFGEGGGQIIRTSLALSCVTGKPFRVRNIRANRPKPGLAPQHLAGVRAAARICNAKLTGDKKRSREFSFEPGEIRNGEYRFDIGTAGSISLLLQVIMPPLATAPGTSKITVTGGTHVSWCPTFDYLREIWARALARLGFEFKLEMKAAGYYPQGGGEVACTIEQAPGIKPLILNERGKLLRVRGISASSNLPGHVRRRQANRIRQRLNNLDVPIEIERVDRPGPAPGTAVIIIPEFENGFAGFTSLGKPRLKAELVAEKAVQEFREFMEKPGAVDRRLADQLLLPAALADGETVYTTTEITNHTLTNADIIQEFVDVSVKISGKIGEPGSIGVAPRSEK
ncbi:MAG: RNA 3'-phosphate cyclase [Planctomycetota bacterium]|nr:MAG: RNA 3'-phosphate cyclase [Planctomycetota bacterium]